MGKRHPHWFSPFAQHYGKHGPQDVHYHPCVEDDCERVLLGDGRLCDGQASTHQRKRLDYWLPEEKPLCVVHGVHQCEECLAAAIADVRKPPTARGDR